MTTEEKFVERPVAGREAVEILMGLVMFILKKLEVLQQKNGGSTRQAWVRQPGT